MYIHWLGASHATRDFEDVVGKFTEASVCTGSPNTRSTKVPRALGAHTFPEHSVHTSSIPTGRPVHADPNGRPVCRIHAGNARWQQDGRCMQTLVVGRYVEYIQEMLDANRSASAYIF